MISILRGEAVEVNFDHLVVNLGGLGLKVFVPAAVLQHIKTGDVVLLHTQLIVREDALTLYGFDTREERDFYNVLLGVEGVGPRTGLNILSTLSLQSIKQAVTASQPEIFCRVSGIGRKTAQKILLHLEDKVAALDTSGQLSRVSDTDGELLAALTGLGYSLIESQTAIQSIPRETEPGLEARLRAALSYFST